MGWKTQGGRKYFHEVKFVDGKRIDRYYRDGLEAWQAAEREAKRLEEDAREREVLAKWSKRDRAIDKKTHAIETFVGSKLDRVLLEAGFHRHKGTLRKRRKRDMSESNESELSKLKQELQVSDQGLTDEKSVIEMEDVVRRLSLEALRGLKGVEHPTLICKVDETIDLITRRVAEIKEEFKMERSNAFDRMMVEQVATAWVQWFVANWLLESEFCQKRSHRQNQYLERRFSRAQVRLSRAIDQLARLRGMSRGALEKGRW